VILLLFPRRVALFISSLVFVLSGIILLLLLQLFFLLLVWILLRFTSFFRWPTLLSAVACWPVFFLRGFLLLSDARLLAALLLQFLAVDKRRLLLPDSINISLAILVKNIAAPLRRFFSSKLEGGQFFCAQRLLLLEVQVRAGGLRAF